MQKNGSKYFAPRPPAIPYPHPLTHGLWSKGQKSFFSEHGHVAYKIKQNHLCSKMVENILPRDSAPLGPPDGVNR